MWDLRKEKEKYEVADVVLNISIYGLEKRQRTVFHETDEVLLIFEWHEIASKTTVHTMR